MWWKKIKRLQEELSKSRSMVLRLHNELLTAQLELRQMQVHFVKVLSERIVVEDYPVEGLSIAEEEKYHKNLEKLIKARFAQSIAKKLVKDL